MKTVTFDSKTYIVEPGAGLPADAIDPAELTGPEQVELHNLLVSNIGEGSQVRKFSDRKAGAKRILAKLRTFGELLEAEQVEPATESPAPEKAKVKAAPKGKPAPKAKTERKKRGMRFVFPFNGRDNMRSIRDNGTLRAECVKLLQKGATFKEVEDLVVKFDAERGKKSEHVERRAYELVRLMHYHIGYGIAHDQKTGEIKLHTREVGK